MRSRRAVFGIAILLALPSVVWAMPRVVAEASSTVRIPLVFGSSGCQPIPSESYGSLTVQPPPTDRPADEHADLNLALRGHITTSAHKGLVDIGGGVDPYAPQLPGLFADNRVPSVVGVYQVHDWDWSRNVRGAPIESPEVTLIGLQVVPGETVHVPESGHDLGQGYTALVLYAHPERITLKYTREDNVVRGYTIHIENLCVEPRLLALYEGLNAAGRGELPALRAGQGLGRARTSELGVSVRDTGRFMDPRSRRDWWQRTAEG